MTTVAQTPFQMAQSQFDRVADLLTQSGRARPAPLPDSRNFFCDPVRMDDGTTQVSAASACSTRLGTRQGDPLPSPWALNTVRDQPMMTKMRQPTAWAEQGAWFVTPPVEHASRSDLPGLGSRDRRNVGANTGVPAPDVMTSAQHAVDAG